MDPEELAALIRALARLSAEPVAPVPGPRGAPPDPSLPPDPEPGVPAVLADLLRSLGRSTPLHDRARSAPSPAARADRRAERAVGPIVRPGRTELDALNTQLAILDQDLNADISSISAALRALDQSLPERADTPEDRARLQKLREAANRLGGLVRTQQDVRGRLGAMMRILADLDDTFSALAAERGPADPG